MTANAGFLSIRFAAVCSAAVLVATAPVAEKPQWLAADVPPEAMKTGGNAVAVTFLEGKSKSVKLIGAELVVRYRKPEEVQRELDSKSAGGLISPFVEEPGVVRMLVSEDGGESWKASPAVDCTPLGQATPYGRFIETEDGTVLMTTYGCLSHEDTSSRIDCCGLYRSTDGGATWGDFSLVAHDKAGREMAYNEMDVQPMPDGTWVAVIRAEWRTHSGGEPSSSSVCFSSDLGRTWTRPQFAFIGAVPILALLPDGGLVCTTSFSKIRFSYDGGHTWSRELPSHTRHYPAAQLLGAENDHLLVHDRWRNRRASIYRRIAAENE